MMQKLDYFSQIGAFRLDFIFKLIPRLVIGAVFIPAGWAKLQSMGKTIEYFANIHIPLSSLLAPVVALSELVFGFFILIGFYTRPSCIPLLIIMAVAILTAHKVELTSLMALIEMPQALYFVILLGIFSANAGTFSVDQLFFRRK